MEMGLGGVGRSLPVPDGIQGTSDGRIFSSQLTLSFCINKNSLDARTIVYYNDDALFFLLENTNTSSQCCEQEAVC